MFYSLLLEHWQVDESAVEVLHIVSGPDGIARNSHVDSYRYPKAGIISGAFLRSKFVQTFNRWHLWRCTYLVFSDHWLNIHFRKCCLFLTCTLYKKIYIGKTGKRLVYHFCSHVRKNVEKTTQIHQSQVCGILVFLITLTPTTTMTICSISLHHRNTESCKNLEDKYYSFFSQVHSIHTESMNASHFIH